MKALRDRILKDGKCFPDGILKVDKFINHQMDPNLMKQICVEFIRRYASTEINKIITIEASGIAPAIMMGFYSTFLWSLRRRKSLQQWAICFRQASSRLPSKESITS